MERFTGGSELLFYYANYFLRDNEIVIIFVVIFPIGCRGADGVWGD